MHVPQPFVFKKNERKPKIGSAKNSVRRCRDVLYATFSQICIRPIVFLFLKKNDTFVRDFEETIGRVRCLAVESLCSFASCYKNIKDLSTCFLMLT